MIGMKPSRGFTILELLVSVTIIAILLGITLPSLVGVSRTAQQVSLLANQQESMRLLLAYANDHKGLFPSFGALETQTAELNWKGEEVVFSWWDQPQYWGLYLQSKGYDGWVSMGEAASPEVYDEMDCVGCGQAFSRHMITAAAFADRSLFRDGAQDDLGAHHPQRVDAARHPSAKIALTLWNVIVPERRTIVHFIDGSGEVIPLENLRSGVELAFIGAWPAPGMLTHDGLLGRDR